MNTATISIKTEPSVKVKAQKAAEELGFSLSSVINSFLKQFIRTKTISVNSEEFEEIPNAKTRKLLRQSEEDVKAGRVSPSFTNVKDAIAWLNDPNAYYENGDKVHRSI